MQFLCRAGQHLGAVVLPVSERTEINTATAFDGHRAQVVQLPCAIVWRRDGEVENVT